MKESKFHILINLILFQLCWSASVIGAANGLMWTGWAMFVVFASWHFSVSASRKADFELVVILLLLGALVDTLFIQFDLLAFATHWPSAALSPVWMLCLWASFALTLNHCMRFLHRHFAWAALLGGVGGAFAYWVAADVWHAVVIVGNPLWVYAIVGVSWAVITPLLVFVAQWLMEREPVTAIELNSN